MGSLALLAKDMGYRVTGSDQHVYPPMSTQLQSQGITLREGYDPSHLDPQPDLVVIGNAMSRGNSLVEYVLNKGLPYTSGPQWLSEHVLRERWVLAVSGTHGKTTTTAMLAWVLEQAGLAPGFLIGGVPLGFDVSARLGDTSFFVIEADEYDSAFFDKRSKFIHYRPRTLIVNNLEFDHADIFRDLADIRRQFNHLMRIVPEQGVVISPSDDDNVNEMLDMGCWSERQTFSINDGEERFSAELLKSDGSEFELFCEGVSVGTVNWAMTGMHNVRNATATVMAARHIGIKPQNSLLALNEFPGVKRRLEKIAERNDVIVYDDFAHHPTAIQLTLQGVRNQVGDKPVIAIIEPRSNTMKMGVHKDSLLPSAEAADKVIWADFSDSPWLAGLVASANDKHQLCRNVREIAEQIDSISGEAYVVLMSNGGFSGLPQRIKVLFEKEKEPV